MKLYLLSLLVLVAITNVHADYPLNLDNNFNIFTFSGVGQPVEPITVNLAAPGFIDVTDAYCAGDQFEVSIDGNSVGKTSTPIPADGCKSFSSDPQYTVADNRWSAGRFSVPAGSHTIRITAIVAPFNDNGAVFVRGVERVCQGPPNVPSDQFALIADAPVSFDDYTSQCTRNGYDPAQITPNNLDLATALSNNCQKSMGKSYADPVFVRSWNGDTYSGTPIALYQSSASGSVNVASGSRFALCQQRPVITQRIFPNYRRVATSSDSNIILVGPAMPQYDAATACALFQGAVPLVLSTSDQETYTAATNLVFNNVGPNGQAWCGGMNAKSLNQPLVLNAGANPGAGAVTANYPSRNADTALYTLCAARDSASARLRRSAEDL